jgi:alcohol dehydrogenase (cytochrome c)
VPHDTPDWNLSQTSPVFTAQFDGKQRNLLVVSGKDGRLRIVDRDTSEVLGDLAVSKQENGDKPTTGTTRLPRTARWARMEQQRL